MIMLNRMKKYSHGKIVTVKGHKAEITMVDPTAEIYKLRGYIFATDQPLIETAWDENGKSIDNKRFNLPK